MSVNLEPDMLFGIPVWDTVLELEEDDSSKLVDKYVTFSETLAGIPTYEAGGWESEFTKHSFSHSLTLEDRFITTVLNQTKKVIKEGYSNRFELTLNGYVIYVTKGEEYVKKHMHVSKGLFISTFFLTAPEPLALLTFYNGYNHITPFMESLDALDYNLTHPVVHYEPRVGRLLTYPAWLPVSMLPGNTDKPRITIDFYFRT
jgi:hypothetical protein